MKRAHDLLGLFDTRKLTNYDKWIAAIEQVQSDARNSALKESAEAVKQCDSRVGAVLIIENLIDSK